MDRPNTAMDFDMTNRFIEAQNVLSALIIKDPDEAEEYLAQFSDIYRYILDNKSKNLVPLVDELVFTKQYMALINTRFNGAYRLNVRHGG